MSRKLVFKLSGLIAEMLGAGALIAGLYAGDLLLGGAGGMLLAAAGLALIVLGILLMQVWGEE